ncbi:hypothetical protein GCM10007047_14360 [Cerasicoccus arenae]|uniref:Uncharacterized protein n=1 Tax=Cerasicoccus arenae TaxID=424488 RepID=A0A8J3GEK0_9BACT|nr:hypothetical protein GCM10007047_14360 [Cerasicoccus arenae]
MHLDGHIHIVGLCAYVRKSRTVQAVSPVIENFHIPSLANGPALPLLWRWNCNPLLAEAFKARCT